MEKIKRLNYRYFIEKYGEPGEKGSREREVFLNKLRPDLVKVDSPFPLQPGNVKTVTMHKNIANAWQEALREILEYYGLAFLQKQGLDQFAGCWVIRKTSGGAWWSMHTWAVAADHCSKLGPFGPPSMIPYHFVNAFLKRGFGWGGNWRGKRDGMHFSQTGT